MSSVNPSPQSSGNSNGRTRSRWAGTGLGGDAIVTEHESRTMTLKQQQEQLGRGTPEFARRQAARIEAALAYADASAPIKERDLPGRAAPEVEYFLENGRYMVTDGTDVEPARKAELDDITEHGTVQKNGRIRFDYHDGLDEADLLKMPADRNHTPEPEQRYLVADVRQRGVERSR
ncbi:hypothetical protein [Nocardia salmonicida]|uniref:hypothetical protein n=1 Tax=Nocardia salmonicida TaxID=53431 RepID=UPI0007A3ADED|nr:hypothetical protein [Nocardia salmonicida]